MNIICLTCKNPKEQTDFFISKNKSGHESSCKECSNLRHYERRRARRLEKNLSIKFPTLAARQLMSDGMKYCPSCKQIKSILNDFSSMKIRSGVASHCKECCNRMAAQRNSTPEYKKKLNLRYKQNRDKSINWNLIKKFGITLEKYNDILNTQNGMCAICNKTPEKNKKMLAVDHNHDTGKNRGLLCSSCNLCIGFIEKNKLDFYKIKLYLDTHNIDGGN